MQRVLRSKRTNLHERYDYPLYQTDGGFVARACQFRLQALADRPADAIEGLRQSFLRYAQRYPIRQEAPASTRLGSRQRARGKQRADYEHAIYWVRQDMGFWRGAEFFLRAATAYRHFDAGESQLGVPEVSTSERY